MIRNNIQAVLEAICDSYSPSIETDVMPAHVFCIHDEKIVDTIRTKEGIATYIYEVGIMVVGASDSEVDPVVETIVSTIEMLSDSDIDEVEYISMEGLQHDAELNKYHNQLTFKVYTNKL